MKTQTNVPLEIQLPKEFKEDVLTVTSSDVSCHVPVFKKANGRSYIRFATPSAGMYSYDLDGKKVSFEVVAYTGGNPLFLHGPLTVSKKKELMHGDNAPFFYLADTLWFGSTMRMSDKDFQSHMNLRKKQGFSAIQIVIGIPPEIEPFDENAKNSGGFPFHKDWSLHPAYFDAVDSRIHEIVEMGLVPVIFGGWGHHIDWMGAEHVKNLWREIIARYSAYPVIFSLAGEVDVFLIPHGIDPKKADSVKTQTKKILERLPRPLFEILRTSKHVASQLVYKRYETKLLAERIKKWTTVGEYISKTDPYRRVLTAHPNRQRSAFDLFGNPQWLTLNAMQSGHSFETLWYMISGIRFGKKPIINLEPWYEGISGNFDSYYQRIAFWMCLLSGACGHGYGAHGIWQYAKKDNFMRHWGNSDASLARTFSGAEQLGLGGTYLRESNVFSFSPDNSCISPTASKSHPLYPLCVKTDKGIFIYIPDQRQIKTLTLEAGLAKKLITVIDPDTMKKSKTMKIAEKTLTMPIDESTRDLLLIFT